MEVTKHYNNTIEVSFDADKHQYIATGGKFDNTELDGVTSCLSVIAKPALKFWAVKMGVEYLDNHLAVNTIVDEVEKARLLEGVRKAHMNRLKDAADIGTLFHLWVEKYINGESPTIPSNPMLKKSVENFLAWVKNNAVEFTCSEQRVLSVKHRFCGTYDFEAIVNGKTVLGDIKTSSGIWNEYWLQLAGYKGALLEEYPNKKINHTIVVRCGKDGSFEVKGLNGFKENYKAFVNALNLWRHMQTMKKPNFIN